MIPEDISCSLSPWKTSTPIVGRQRSRENARVVGALAENAKDVLTFRPIRSTKTKKVGKLVSGFARTIAAQSTPQQSAVDWRRTSNIRLQELKCAAVVESGKKRLSLNLVAAKRNRLKDPIDTASVATKPGDG
jgi:hypothetical protein